MHPWVPPRLTSEQERTKNPGFPARRSRSTATVELSSAGPRRRRREPPANGPGVEVLEEHRAPRPAGTLAGRSSDQIAQRPLGLLCTAGRPCLCLSDCGVTIGGNRSRPVVGPAGGIPCQAATVAEGLRSRPLPVPSPRATRRRPWVFDSGMQEPHYSSPSSARG